MLATQWILFSFLPCSHGWKEKDKQKQSETAEPKFMIFFSAAYMGVYYTKTNNVE